MNTATPTLDPLIHDDPTTGEEPGYVEWVREQIARALAETGPGKEHDQFMAEMRQRILSRRDRPNDPEHVAAITANHLERACPVQSAGDR